MKWWNTTFRPTALSGESYDANRKKLYACNCAFCVAPIRPIMHYITWSVTWLVTWFISQEPSISVIINLLFRSLDLRTLWLTLCSRYAVDLSTQLQMLHGAVCSVSLSTCDRTFSISRCWQNCTRINRRHFMLLLNANWTLVTVNNAISHFFHTRICCHQQTHANSLKHSRSK